MSPSISASRDLSTFCLSLVDRVGCSGMFPLGGSECLGFAIVSPAIAWAEGNVEAFGATNFESALVDTVT